MKGATGGEEIIQNRCCGIGKTDGEEEQVQYCYGEAGGTNKGLSIYSIERQIKAA